jgi:hypothetical protein
MVYLLLHTLKRETLKLNNQGLISARPRNKGFGFIKKREMALVFFLCIFFAAFQSAATQLTPETSLLLERALSTDSGAGINTVYEAMRQIPDRPDWQAALDVMMDQLRSNPAGDNNNRCLIIEFILSKHSDEASMDLGPLIPVLKTQDAFNQQKAAQVIIAVISRHDLVKPIEQDLIRALIPLTTSQRERVVRPAVQALESLTGQQSIGRDPDGWIKWYFSNFHEKIDLSRAVYELLVVVRVPDNNNSGFILNGHPVPDDKSLEEEILALKTEAERKGLRISLAVITDQESLDSDEIMHSLLDGMKSLEPAVKAAGIEAVTFAPRTEKYYLPWKPSNDSGQIGDIR